LLLSFSTKTPMNTAATTSTTAAAPPAIHQPARLFFGGPLE
jgi:hypothetical protein